MVAPSGPGPVQARYVCHVNASPGDEKSPALASVRRPASVGARLHLSWSGRFRLDLCLRCARLVGGELLDRGRDGCQIQALEVVDDVSPDAVEVGGPGAGESGETRIGQLGVQATAVARCPLAVDQALSFQSGDEARHSAE